jgi:hypothetical protein
MCGQIFGWISDRLASESLGCAVRYSAGFLTDCKRELGMCGQIFGWISDRLASESLGCAVRYSAGFLTDWQARARDVWSDILPNI